MSVVARKAWPLWVALSALACAALVSIDPYVSPALPFPLFNQVLPEKFPYKLTIFLASGLLLGWLVQKIVGLAANTTYLLIALIFAFAQMGGLKAGPLDGLDVVTLIGFLLILTDRLLNPHKPLFSAGLFFFAGALLLLDMVNFIDHLSASHIIAVSSFLRAILLAWLLVNLITDAASARFAVNMFIAVAIISALIGISQGLLFLLFGIDFSFIDQFGASDTQYKPTPFGMLPRASALNGSAQHLSSFLLIALPFLLFRWHESTGKTKQRMTVAIAVVLGGVLSTWNYGGFFAVLVVLLLYPFFQWPRYSIHILCGMLSLLIFCYFTGVLDWLYSVSFGNAGVSKGVSQRHTLLSLGLEKLVKDPWFGVGLHGFTDTPGNYWRRPVHNAYIQAATEIGIVGALVFLTMLMTMVTQAILSSIHFGRAWSHLARASALSILGLMWLMLTEPMVDHSNTWLILGLTQALLLTGWRDLTQERL